MFMTFSQNVIDQQVSFRARGSSRGIKLSPIVKMMTIRILLYPSLFVVITFLVVEI
jgi:hypothetical protein